jgi:hypothetical protein
MYRAFFFNVDLGTKQVDFDCNSNKGMLEQARKKFSDYIAHENERENCYQNPNSFTLVDIKINQENCCQGCLNDCAEQESHSCLDEKELKDVLQMNRETLIKEIVRRVENLFENLEPAVVDRSGIVPTITWSKERVCVIIFRDHFTVYDTTKSSDRGFQLWAPVSMEKLSTFLEEFIYNSLDPYGSN